MKRSKEDFIIGATKGVFHGAYTPYFITTSLRKAGEVFDDLIQDRIEISEGLGRAAGGFFALGLQVPAQAIALNHFYETNGINGVLSYFGAVGITNIASVAFHAYRGNRYVPEDLAREGPIDRDIA
jgi:hypothetical protein